MMYSEFCEMLGNSQKISMNDYKLIEFVYTWSPLIPEYDGKKEIVRLFELGGMELIRQLIPACRLIQTKEKLQQRFDKTYEKCESYQTIAGQLDKLHEDSSKYWEKSRELIDEMSEILTDMDQIDKEFEID